MNDDVIIRRRPNEQQEKKPQTAAFCRRPVIACWISGALVVSGESLCRFHVKLNVSQKQTTESLFL